MDKDRFTRWLTRYGEVWESRYPEGVADLYSPDVLYYWTPFEEPKRGLEAITEASRQASARQQDIKFGFEVLAVSADKGLARWWCSFTRVATGRKVNLDGILQAMFTRDDLCSEFREWWHSDEPLSERL